MGGKVRPPRLPAWATALLAAVALLCALLGSLRPSAAQAQEAGVYTVQAGDTLGEIATRFGVSLEALVQANAIQDPSLIHVGQELIIPTGSASGLSSGPTYALYALPGETVARLAGRAGLEPAALAAFNGISETARLFPGQPLAAPGAAPEPDLRFGAVTRVDAPAELVQGKTGLLLLESNRPLSATAVWNDLQLPLRPLDGDPQRLFALIPVPALLGPGAFPLTLTYQASNGLPVSRTWQVNVLDGGYITQQIVLPPEKGGLLDPAVVQAEYERMVSLWMQVTPELRWRTTFTRPISVEYETTSPYGTRRTYNDGTNISYHAGQDFGAPEGVPILAPAPGTVVLAEPLTVRGGAVLIDHGAGIFTGYWHMSQIDAQVGQQVNSGDVLGLVGTTGLSTGAHLHWEMLVYGIAVDPMQFIDSPLLPQAAAAATTQ